MTSIEDRLRVAARAAADTVADGSAPPLRLPQRRTARWPTFPRGRRTLLAAPAAALAVAAIVITASLVARGPATRTGAGASPGPPVAHAIVPPALPPPYAVSLTYVGQYKSWKIARTDAVVTASMSGAVIATVRPPAPYNAFVAVTSTDTQHGRTFVLAAQHLAPPQERGPGSFPSTRLYQLQVSPSGSGAQAKLTPLPIPIFAPATFGDMALSPDGTQLAVAQNWWENGRPVQGLRLYSMRAGTSGDWVLSIGRGYPVEDVESPSWEANGRLLAMDTSTGKCLDCIRLLNTAEGGTLLDASQLLVRSPNLHTQVDWDATLLSPDGSTVLRSAIVSIPVGKNTSYDVSRIYRYARSGRLEKTMNFAAHGVDLTMLWCTGNGRDFIVSRVSESTEAGFATASLYAGGRWYALALPAQTLSVSW
jgi:hypothetical protein